MQMKAALALLLVVLAVAVPAWMPDRRVTLLVLGLIALPYAVAFGTGNSIFTQIIVSMAPWGALIAALQRLSALSEPTEPCHWGCWQSSPSHSAARS